MTLVDANVLVYAFVSSMPQHIAAKSWLDEELSSGRRVGLPWESLVAFIRLTTNARVFARPVTVKVAWRQVQSWIAVPSVWVPTPTERHQAVLDRCIGPDVVAGLVHDAHLAALAMTHGLEVISTDGDFARFPGLRWRNPVRRDVHR